jgi:hypothetical protein
MARGWSLMLVALMVLGAAAALVAGFGLAAEPDQGGIEVGASASGEMLAGTGADPFALGQAKPTTGRIDVERSRQAARCRRCSRRTRWTQPQNSPIRPTARRTVSR